MNVKNKLKSTILVVFLYEFLSVYLTEFVAIEVAAHASDGGRRPRPSRFVEADLPRIAIVPVNTHRAVRQRVVHSNLVNAHACSTTPAW